MKSIMDPIWTPYQCDILIKDSNVSKLPVKKRAWHFSRSIFRCIVIDLVLWYSDHEPFAGQTSLVHWSLLKLNRLYWNSDTTLFFFFKWTRQLTIVYSIDFDLMCIDIPYFVWCVTLLFKLTEQVFGLSGQGSNNPKN